MNISKYTERIAQVIKVYQPDHSHINRSNINLSFIDRQIPKDSLVFLGGRPRTGKTSLLLDFIVKNALNKTHKQYDISTLEAPKKVLAYFISHKEDWLLARWCSIVTQSLIKKDESEESRSSILNQYFNLVQEASIDFNFVRDINELLLTVESNINTINPDIIIIDGYNFPIDNRYNEKNIDDSEQLQQLISLQKKTKRMFVISSCLGSEAFQRGGYARHVIEDFHSQIVASESDIVLTFHRPELYGIECDEEGFSLKGVIEIETAINRYGNEGETTNWHAIHEIPKLGKLRVLVSEI